MLLLGGVGVFGALLHRGHLGVEASTSDTDVDTSAGGHLGRISDGLTIVTLDDGIPAFQSP